MSNTTPDVTPCRCPDREIPVDPDLVMCGTCERQWCNRCNPVPAARCPFEYEHVERLEPDTVTVTLSADAAAVVAAFVAPAYERIDPTAVHASPEVFAEIARAFPVASFWAYAERAPAEYKYRA